jgi:hypothetical protein
MDIESEIEGIRAGIRAGRFSNEASVSQGIVLRLLHALGWSTYDTQCVWPEYSLAGRRVDFALCHPPSRPMAIIEVKQLGQSDGAERQLFEYAFHEGVPLAILTDGREWNFFLPAEQGNYGDRRVYKLDIVQRELSAAADRLRRYLLYSSVASGAAIEAARNDYRNVARERQMLATLPAAWEQLVREEDELLLEVVADRVESLCGYKPPPDTVAAFLKQLPAPGVAQVGPNGDRPVGRPTTSNQLLRTVTAPTRPAPASSSGRFGFKYRGRFCPSRSAIDVLRQVLEALAESDGTFNERFSSLPEHGRTRRYLAQDPEQLYPGRSDLARDCSFRLTSGWWMSTNHSRHSIQRIIAMACEVANVSYGSELIVHLGEAS